MKRRRNFGRCRHSSTITTITAGLAREVCEVCGHVSVSYVENAVKLNPNYPEVDVAGLSFDAEPTAADLEEASVFEAMVTFEERSRLVRCGLCTQPAVFMIPDGLRCDEHAWQAAARLDWGDSDLWVPIRIDRSNA